MLFTRLCLNCDLIASYKSSRPASRHRDYCHCLMLPTVELFQSGSAVGGSRWQSAHSLTIGFVCFQVQRRCKLGNELTSSSKLAVRWPERNSNHYLIALPTIVGPDSVVVITFGSEPNNSGSNPDLAETFFSPFHCRPTWDLICTGDKDLVVGRVAQWQRV